jgi:glycosyltransferase involved in cell wall biosynthesis
MVLVPSRCETFSMVTLEAMAVGAVVVARRCGGPEELLEGGVSGVLCDTDAELAQALVGLSRDSSARRRMGEAARRRSREFSSLRTAVQMLELYRLGLETRAQ